MVGTRFFNSGREGGRVGVASEIMRFEIMKNGKLPAADRYKMILKKKLEASKQQAMAGRVKLGGMPGNLKEARKMSKLAEQKLKEVAMKKAAKEAKKLRQMVIVTPRNYSNGSIDKKGKIYDIAGNVVAQVNTKNGKMATMNGWGLGRYKNKSYMTDLTIQNAITQHSPYFIQQRKMQMLQQQGVEQFGVFGPTAAAVSDTMNTYGVHGPAQNSFNNFFGSDLAPQRQNVGMTSWGARSDNVWGNFADNAWGGFADNVWGGNNSDVWGGISAPSGWGQKGPRIWGTGSGKNYLAKLTNAVAALFGLSSKQSRQRLASLNAAASRSAGRSAGSATRTAAAPSAPTSGGRR